MSGRKNFHTNNFHKIPTQKKDHDNIYVIDRGLQATSKMAELDNSQIKFVGRLKESRVYRETMPIVEDPTSEPTFDGLRLILDSKAVIGNGERRKNVDKIELEVRVVIVERLADSKRFIFVTNDFTLSYDQVAAFYKKRWDIEVFFRFIKQELNVSHLVSLNKNGMEVMLYMTLIVAMLILIYKKENAIGYKTAKRRFTMEMRHIIIELAIITCGGNPDIFFR